ncbi:hypothetical protein QBC34DRAFT_441265 [Podospora aff. communis PSN243]|uniref:MARVEL domain-containing protein n=1 Tax=Podospora aff. communis PSN243 TaxID=3040156 RepID=A0AAV9GDV7_9PEZI|nr:hypothetical protein QBC34DRAFT_441265 [Podospora aff. communis PSN243]
MEHKVPERSHRGRMELRSEWEMPREPPTAMSTLPKELLLPYPAWSTYFFRGMLAIYETGVLAFAVWVFHRWQQFEPVRGVELPFPKDRYTIPLIVIVAALLANLSALVAIIAKRYHVAGLWRWMALMDAAVGALGIYGSIMMTTRSEGGRKGADIAWLDNHNIVAALLFALGTAHSISCLGGLVGMRLVAIRRKDLA